MAGMLSMSQAGVAAIEEPEAHLSWAAQVRVAKALRELVPDPDRPPFQLLVTTHSLLMKEVHQSDDYFEVKMVDGETRIERSLDAGALEARFVVAGMHLTPQPRWLYPGNLVQLSDKAVEYLGAKEGDRLYELYLDDGSIAVSVREQDAVSVGLITESRLGEHLAPPECQQEYGE